MSKRLLILAAAAALLAAACAKTPAAELTLGEGTQFVPQIADFLDDVGMDPSMVLDGSGVPHITYFGFPQPVEKGEVPVQRPVTAPTVPAIMLLTQDKGAFSRGAVAMQSIPPLVDWPTGPAAVPDLATIAPGDVNGTAVAVDASGGTYAAWAADTGLWFASNSGSGFTVSQVVTLDPPAQRPGPLGAPGVAVDASGMPWVAYAYNSQDGFQVVAAMPQGDSWKTITIATIEQCSGCDQGLRTAIGATKDGLIVVWADTASGDVMAARSADGESWTPEVVEAGGGGLGLSLAIGSKGETHVAYATRIGEIREATSSGGLWKVTKVAAAAVGESSYEPSTGVAVDDAGTSYVAWYDSATDSVMAAAEQSGAFVPLSTPDTAGGSSPAIAVTPDGSTIYLAWYDHEQGNLMLGAFEDTAGLALAATQAPPSGQPTSAPTTAPPTSVCPKGGVKITAPVGAVSTGFAETEITVDAGKPFTVCFENQDTGIPHNVGFYDKQGGTEFAKTEIATGPILSTVEVPAQQPGEYWFQCDVHPTTMTGKLVVK